MTGSRSLNFSLCGRSCAALRSFFEGLTSALFLRAGDFSLRLAGGFAGEGTGRAVSGSAGAGGAYGWTADAGAGRVPTVCHSGGAVGSAVTGEGEGEGGGGAGGGATATDGLAGQSSKSGHCSSA